EWDAKDKGRAVEAEWDERFNAYSAEFPALAIELMSRLNGDLPLDFSAKADEFIAEVAAKGETIASRKASQNTLNAFGPLLP
ncbi:transketolase, partial [Klebsiella pneumoniae]|nr:transketolase [Klebsiella pneumoniae]